MAIPNFSTFYPDVVRWISTKFRQEYRLIVDNETAKPIGIVNPNANGAQGIWAMTPISSAEVLAPTAAMLQDLGATFQLNQAPYGRYRSDGIQLVSLDSEAGTIIPPGINEIFFSPLVITEAGGPLIIEGGLRVVQ